MSDPSQPNAAGRLWTATSSWVAEPIVGSVDTLDLILLVGIVLVSIFLWTRILAHFSRE